jgi:MUN domain
MSSNNRYARDHRPRGNSTQQDIRPPPKSTPHNAKKVISRDDAYSYGLRAAFLAYLLLPRQKRTQHVAGPANSRPVHRTSAMDLLKDFSGSGRHTSQKFPHGFMAALDKRVTGVLVGTEKLPEFNNDPLIKRSFGAFLNEFMNPVKRKNLERDRKMEDLLLIFYANGVKELQKGKAPDDDSWKWMSDRHLAMFIRLISSILRDNDWARDRPELANRLQNLEKKLLMHDMDLTVDSTSNGGSAGTTIEVEVPLSYEVKDMPLVLLISRIFDISYGKIQDDINQHKSQWTEEAALKDLKIYQQCISLKTKNTINFEDFDTESAYESWKKNEIHEVSQMLFAIMQINPNLAKTSTGTSLPQLQNITSPSESTFAEISRTLSENPDSMDSFSIDHAMDFAAMNIKDDPAHEGVEVPFTFIPPDQRLYYKAIVKETLLNDIREQDPADAPGESPLLSKKSTELLTEIASRWRVPTFSRRILLLDAVRELYEERDIGLETVDRGFIYFKQMPDEKTKSKRKSTGGQELVSDWTKWTLKDLTMYQQCLAAIHANILRDLFQVLQGIYGPKSPAFGMFMYVLTTHLYDDDLFPKSGSDLDQFGDKLAVAFRERAGEVYSELLEKHIPKGEDQWEFFHVIQLGKGVVTLCDKIQKRFKKTPSFFGASPLTILVKRIFPNLAEDAQHLVRRIMDNAKNSGNEIPIEDGFELYREFVDIRNVHKSVLPDEPFKFHLEDTVQEFAWRWLQRIEENLPNWVEQGVKQDQFQMMSPPGSGGEEERYSASAFDMFRSIRETRNQLKELNWDDPYQHAKFSTRVAKAVGLGVARYCELLEQKFSKEMDRLTPEQEAALNQSQQEKWMQLAKNALTGPEKVEPFNFFPEVSIIFCHFDIRLTMTVSCKTE